jgi:membrane-bound metal-dependent hydrolase YbcI (DUF457 family)
MDVLYHGIIGFTVAKVLGSPDMIPAAAAAMVPDVIGRGIPFFYFKLLKTHKKTTSGFLPSFWRSANSNMFDNKFERGIYQLFHSFLALPLAALMSYWLCPASWFVLTIAYTAHILIDIPTHDGDFATQFLYPFSTIHYEGKNWLKHPARFLFFWAALIAILFAFRVI